MSVTRTSLICARTREHVSLALDGELSELEWRLLEAHLARCATCAAYAREVVAFTEQLRASPPALLSRPIVVRRYRRPVPGRLQVVAAAVLASLVVGIVGQLSSSSERPALSHFDDSPYLSPPRSVLDREQQILRVVRPGITLPPPGSVL
ncbi:MAG: zf-HC2 domain-containing protein [Thermoleophilia bacterium]|nr:zf-HC2 domain-containing protein [Gaiellaceae bacterium]MDW8337942.1 zf-HC2 domain-containing protein [Thermoleophilia bacterium]